MKKIVITALSLMTMNVYALETHLATSLAPSHGKVNHRFESTALHGFYIHNNTAQVRKYRWFIKQCIIHDGWPNVCAVNESDYLTLQPDQVFEFHKQSINHMACGGTAGSVTTYAVSHLNDDLKHVWEVPAMNHAECDY